MENVTGIRSAYANFGIWAKNPAILYSSCKVARASDKKDKVLAKKAIHV